jgi:hypothetical protein
VKPYITAVIFLAAGAALVVFAVVNALLLYTAGVPKIALNMTAPILGQQITLKIQGVPDPYYLGIGVVRGVMLLVIGLIGAKLMEIGLAEWRERRRDEALRRYYEQYEYQYQQY